MRLGWEEQDNEQLVARMLPLTKEVQQSTQDKRFLYLNPGQLMAYQFGSRNLTLECGRGFGKTSILALFTNNVSASLPRGLGLLVGSSIKSVLGKTTPAMIKSWETMLGVYEGVHFFRGRPPKAAKFQLPMNRPRSYDNAIVFSNGFTWLQISLMSRANANGLTVQSIIGDEARFLQWDQMGDVMPALRPEAVCLKGWDERINPYYLSTFFMSDSPITAAQKGFQIRREQQTPEINYKIADMLRDLRDAPELGDPETDLGRRFLTKLQKLRCQSSLYLRFSSVENIEILGQDYLKRMKRDLPELVYNIQILGQDLTASKDGFYFNFDENIHGYLTNPSDDENRIYGKFNAKYKRQYYDKSSALTRSIDFEAPDNDALLKIDDCSLDTDLQWDLPLHIAFDVGANLNVAVVGQVFKMDGVDSLVILKTFYTKNERKLESLCNDIVKYYKPKINAGCPDLILYTDSTMRQGQSYALEAIATTRYDHVMKEALQGGNRRNGFKVFEKHIGQPMTHEGRYRFINSLYAGTGKMTIRINKEQCEYLIVALQSAQVKFDNRGIHKQKQKEKYRAEASAGRVEERTDVTDAHDLLVCGVRFNGSMRSAGFGSLTFSIPKVM